MRESHLRSDADTTGEQWWDRTEAEAEKKEVKVHAQKAASLPCSGFPLSGYASF